MRTLWIIIPVLLLYGVLGFRLALKMDQFLSGTDTPYESNTGAILAKFWKKLHGCWEALPLRKYVHHISHTRIIAFSFILVILTGTLLLSLPFATRDGSVTPVIDCLFTATSATCVTGLVVYDTFTHWSLFGQLTILCMIQIGGIGLMTLITMFAIFMKKQIGLHERMLLMQSSGNIRVSGVIRLVQRICLGTFCMEALGALLLFFRFFPEFGWKKGLYYSIFHAISAFCNAGFDLMGSKVPSSSLTGYVNDPLVNLTIMTLIVVGGIGFLVWSDIGKFKFRFPLYSLHSKIVLATTGFLIFSGALLFLVLEPACNPLSALFMSVTTRTAGFNTIDISALSDSSAVVSMILMLIGGSPGSTAGGIKTTTIAVIFLTVVALGKGQSDVIVFNRKIDDSLIKNAAAIIFTYFIDILVVAMIICTSDGIDFLHSAFEAVSAAGTVGLTMGITSSLGTLSKAALLLLMFCGRIGALSMILVFGEQKKKPPLQRPLEKVLLS
ncbi:MAG: TrkH family potassium uptake protein [Lachnospiraceae bacterium]|nr:TrkH family potassium uptake protein [Lachnospiraceae bacterium]